MTKLIHALTASTALVALPAGAGPIADSVAGNAVSLTTCMDLVAEQIGASIDHVEFESRNGEPTYELIVSAEDARYYVGCSGRTGLITEIDRLPAPDDPTWTALAKLSEEEAKRIGLERYPGELEEIKPVLLQSGEAVYELDIEIAGGNGELNVYVNAADGSISQVNVEYWEIPESMPGDAN